MNNTVLHSIDTQRFAEECAKTALDISAEKDVVLAFASRDGYKKKLN